jgi:hypothetical protein
MVEYYKTQKGYCYKKTQKGGSKRISNKDYEKKTKLKSGGMIPDPPPLQEKTQNTTKTITAQQKEGELEFNFIVNDIKFDLDSDIKFDLDSAYDEITKEINKYITETNYEISVNDNKISIKKKGQGGGKQNKRKNKKQKGGVNIDLKLLLKKLKCFGNTDFSQNANQKNAIQEIEKVYNHMKDKYTIKQLQENARLPLSAFEKLSKDIINESIPDFDPSKMIETIKSNYIEVCKNTNQQPQPQQTQSQKQNKNANNNNYSSDVFKLVIALCVLIVNKLNVLPRLNVNKNINKITVFGYVVYLLALLFLKILKEMKRITII